jgi:DNA repair exonuclease SbcCD nuclease subunit
MLYVLGDIQFNISRQWQYEAGDAFLEWFDSEINPPEDSSILQVGDLMDDSSNTGEVIRQVERFLNICKKKFKHTYLLVGNHDIARHKEKYLLSFDFAEEREHVTILRKPAEILTIEDMKVLSLPYYREYENLTNMERYYSHLPKPITDEKFDLVVGHFALNGTNGVFGETIKLPAELNYQHIALGHIHIRTNDYYTGSVFPIKVSEEHSPEPRSIFVFNKKKDTTTKTTIPIPKYIEYCTIEFNDELPAVDDSVIPVYTVRNAKTKEAVHQRYGEGIHVRKVIIDSIETEENEDADIARDSSILNMDLKKAFNLWRKEKMMRLSPKVLKIIEDVL